MNTQFIITVSIGILSICSASREASGQELNTTGSSLSEGMASAIARGNKALFARQHADDGSWGGDDVKVQSSHKSDYPVAISSLAYLALMTTTPESKEALSARKRSLEFILDTIKDGKVRGSIGRSVQLEVALLEAGKGSVTKLETAVETYFKFRERVDIVRDLEEGCHHPPYQIGTFYAFFGYYYLAQALQMVEDDMRNEYLPVLQNHFLKLQKPDGHWIDSRDHCGESYGPPWACWFFPLHSGPSKTRKG